jgi:murein DD-endopeptidase MepM/ murein hydrolase activator NlpD
MSARRSAAVDHGGPGESVERAGRGVVLFWSAIVLFIAALAFWVPRHRVRRSTAAPHLPAELPAPARGRADTVPGPPNVSPPGLVIPVVGVAPSELHDSFAEIHSGHRHEAIDILAPRGTPVVAVADGTIRKLFHSVPGGITIYEFDPAGTLCYYYAHLDRYADGLTEGQRVAAGDVVGYVGTSGNAPPQTPHLHFAIYRLGPEKLWWEGVALDPYPVLLHARRP